MTTNKNALEWSVFAVSALLIIAVLTVLISAARRTESGPADLSVLAERPLQTRNGYVVPLLVRNDGGETAEEARIEATLIRSGSKVETSEVSLQFVPQHSSRKAAVVFQNDPGSGALQVRVTGFARP